MINRLNLKQLTYSLLVTGIMMFACMDAAVAANKSRISVYEHQKFNAAAMPCSGEQAIGERLLMLMGGGTDVDAGYQSMIEHMCAVDQAGTPVGGNFVVIRASGNPAYDSYIYQLAQKTGNEDKIASVVTLVVPPQLDLSNPDSADSSLLKYYVSRASAVFFTGGDQYNYYITYKDTWFIEQISSLVANSKVPVGGTSAGLMMLSQIDYVGDPNYGSGLTSLNLLQNYTRLVPQVSTTLKTDFWTYTRKSFTPPYSYFPSLTRAVADAHFSARERMGRLAIFKLVSGARRAIGVNAGTALLMKRDENNNEWLNVVSNVSDGAVYVLTDGSVSSLNAPSGGIAFCDMKVNKLTPKNDIGPGGNVSISNIDNLYNPYYVRSNSNGLVELSDGKFCSSRPGSVY